MEVLFDIDNNACDLRVERLSNGFKVYTVEKTLKKKVDSTSVLDFLIDSEFQTVYKKSDGSYFLKKTHHRPLNSFYSQYSDPCSYFYLQPGMTNHYDHTCVNVYEQFKFNL